MLYFITGNKKKLAEVQLILPQVEQLDIDLPEIQELDPKKVIEAKLAAAFAHHTGEGEFIIDDTSLELEGLNGLPGTFIKWFLQTVGNVGLQRMAETFGNDRAVARTVIGYASSRDDIHYFEGVVTGRVVKPEPGAPFGWDPIFLADGETKRFGDMTIAEKNLISPRGLAVKKLKEFWIKNKTPRINARCGSRGRRTDYF